MAKDAEWGKWLRAARRAYDDRHDGEKRLSYGEIGARVGALLGRPAFRHTTVRAWFVSGQEPESMSVMRALLGVLEADAGYVVVPRAEAQEDYEISPSAQTVESDEVRARNRKVAAAKRAVRKMARGKEKSAAKKTAAKKESVA